jgi:hypothetical protein
MARRLHSNDAIPTIEPWLDHLSLREAQRRSNLEDRAHLARVAVSLTLLA